MNKIYIAVVLSLVQCSLVCAQLTPVKPSLEETPHQAFSSGIPNETSWIVTIKSAAELREQKTLSALKDIGPEANIQESRPPSLVKIENSYRSGMRKETLIYSDGSQLIRYVTDKEILLENPVSGEPLFDDFEFSTSGSTTGVNKFEELSWISNKYYIGVARYRGRDCYVYRQFISEQSRPPDADNVSADPWPSAAFAGLKDASNAKIQGTAFIDKQTMKPIAYETIYESRNYEMQVPYAAFELPDSIKQALKTRSEVSARRSQSYNIRR